MPQSSSKFACEIDEHDPTVDATPAADLPDGKGGSFLICETCLRELFEEAVSPVKH